MITSSNPDSWKNLQQDTARILEECGFSVEVEKVVETARGSVELDVYAEENVDGRRYSIVCECKHWRSNVPQNVIHGFRTVVGDLGANLGLIVTSSGFQAGTTPAAAYTNVQLVTWDQFQKDFEKTWLKRYLMPTIAKRCDPLLTYTEPLLPEWFGMLNNTQKDEYLTLKRQHDEFGWLMMTFTPYVRIIEGTHFPQLPLRPRVASVMVQSVIPDEVLDAIGYRQFLDAALAHSDDIIKLFRALRPCSEAPSEHE